MTQSVELLLDETSEAAVVDQWRLLDEAGLPSQARHGGDTNRPHVTLTDTDAVAEDAEAALVRVCTEALPLDVLLGGLALFGGDPVVLARLVVPTAELVELHGAVARLVGQPDDSLLTPGRWTPHVTLARRLPLGRLPAALRGLAASHQAGPRSGLPARVREARRWDGVNRRVWLLR